MQCNIQGLNVGQMYDINLDGSYFDTSFLYPYKLTNILQHHIFK